MYELMYTDGNALGSEKFEQKEPAIARANNLYALGYAVRVDDLESNPAENKPILWKY